MRRNLSRVAPLVLSLALAFPAVAYLSGCDSSANLSADEHIDRAKDFQIKGNTRSNILELKNAIQKDPNNAQARWLLGATYLDLRMGSEAETHLEKAVQLGIGKQSARIPQARAQLYQGNFQKILDSLLETDTTDPASLAQILDLRGNALLGLGKHPEGCALFNRAIQLDSTYPPAYLGRAKCEFNAGQTSAAVATAKQATAIDPKRIESWYLLGDLYRTLGQTNEALAAYDQALKIRADDFDALAYKTMTLLSADRAKDAEPLLQRLEKMRPQAMLVRYMKAYLAHRQGKNSEAAILLQDVLKDNPNNPQAHLLYGAINYALGNNETALSSLNKTIDTIGHPEARILLAATQLRMGANADVRNTLAPLLAEGNHAKAFLLAGQAELNQGELDRGMALLQRASAIAPKDTFIRTTLAQNQLLSGDQQGIRGLESVIADNPNDTQAFLLLASSQAEKSNFKGALDTLQKMASAQPENPLTPVLMGRVHLMAKNRPAARLAFEQSLKIDASFLPAASALAGLDILENKPDQARNRFKPILSKTPNNLGALMGQARTALALGDQTEFVASLKTAIQQHPAAFEPASQLTQHYIQQAKQPKLALEIAQAAARNNSSNPAFMELLGQAQLSAGRKKDAIDTFTLVANRHPNSSHAWYRLAWAQRVSGDMNAALKSLQKAVRLAPSNLDARIALAGVYAALGQQEQALQETRAIQELDPKSVTGHNLEAELAARFKKPDAALQALARAHQTVPSADTAATYHLALTRAGKAEQAEQLARQWLKRQPDNLEFRVYLAEVHQQQQRTSQAIAQYQQVVKAEPNHVRALNNLAALLQEQNDPSAHGYAQRAYALQAANPVVMDTYGWSLLQQGKLQEAMPLLKQAALAMPNSPGVQYHWAYALTQSGKHSEANVLLKKALASQQRFGEREQAAALLRTIEAAAKP